MSSMTVFKSFDFKRKSYENEATAMFQFGVDNSVSVSVFIENNVDLVIPAAKIGIGIHF